MWRKGDKVYNGGSLTYWYDGGVFSGIPTEQQLEDWGFEKVVPHTPTEQELIEQARQAKLFELDEYDNSDAVNSFSIGGVSMWIDAETRQRIRLSIEAYSAQGEESMTKWFGGHSFTFPLDTWLYMLNQIEVYASEALNVTEAHRAAINALSTIAEIESYDFTLNYPDKVEL